MSNTKFIRPHFPPTIDSTILAAFRSCPQKAFRQYMEHWKPRGESVHLIAGGAFAKGIEVARRAFFEGQMWQSKISREGTNLPEYVSVEGLAGDSQTAEALGISALIEAYGDYECPPDSAKSCERMAGALEYYFTQYPLGMDGATPIKWADGKSGIEFSFAQPLDILHPETGAPLLYTGRADMIADFAGGIYLFDEKTTSSLGQSWSKQWELRSQFTGYTWAAQQVGIPVSGVIVRGVSILKTKYDTMQVPSGRQQHEIDRWLLQVHRDVKRMIKYWEESVDLELGHAAFDFNLDHSCAEYGGCSLVQICKQRDPDEWLPMYFEKRVWDPLARQQTTVEEYNAKWFGEEVANPGVDANEIDRSHEKISLEF